MDAYGAELISAYRAPGHAGFEITERDDKLIGLPCGLTATFQITRLGQRENSKQPSWQKAESLILAAVLAGSPFISKGKDWMSQGSIILRAR